VSQLVFAPDGERLIVGAADGSVRLLDGETGQELLELGRGDLPVSRFSVSHDGARLAVVTDAVRVYALPVDDGLALARARITGDLTPAELAEFLHESPPAVVGGEAAGPSTVRSPEEVVRDFVAAWSAGQPEAVESLFASELRYDLNIDGQDLNSLGAPAYPLTSASDIRAFAAYHTQGTPGEFQLAECTPGQEGILNCQLTYGDACIQVLRGGPLHLQAAFRIADGKIRETTGSAEPAEAAQLSADYAAVLKWAEVNRPDDYLTYSFPTAVNSEGAAIQYGRIYLRLCEGYAAAQKP
jgi:hypothetical protein